MFDNIRASTFQGYTISNLLLLLGFMLLLISKAQVLHFSCFLIHFCVLRALDEEINDVY